MLAPRLQEQIGLTAFGPLGDLENGKNGAYGNVDIDVGGTIQRIKGDQETALGGAEDGSSSSSEAMPCTMGSSNNTCLRMSLEITSSFFWVSPCTLVFSVLPWDARQSAFAQLQGDLLAGDHQGFNQFDQGLVGAIVFEVRAKKLHRVSGPLIYRS